ADFIAKTFAPVEAAPAEKTRMMQYLGKGEIWAKASAFKTFQQNNPLSGDLSGTIDRLIVLRGGKDVAVPWEVQEKIMREVGVRPDEIVTLPELGHSLPWSIDQKVLETIRGEFSADHAVAAAKVAPAKTDSSKKVRIGYQPGSTPQNNVLSYLESHLVNFPDRVALRWVNTPDIQKWDGSHNSPLPHNEITYAQFGKMINTVAQGLRNLGIEKGDRVIIFLPMNTLMYTAMFAVQRLGAIAVFLDSWARSSHLGASASCAQPKAMISHKAAFDLIREVPEFSTMPLWIIAGPGNDGSYAAQLEKLLEVPGSTEVVPVESENTALITFTTGSSGTPKGANRTHRFLCAQHESLSQVVPYGPTDKDMPAFPIFSLNNLASGVTTILPAISLAAPSDRDSAAMVSQILHEKLTCTTLSPSMLNGVSAYCIANKIQLVSLRRVVTG
ncbi:MAG: AMP-ligase, partial [Proteobacteria bacterium]